MLARGEDAAGGELGSGRERPSERAEPSPRVEPPPPDEDAASDPDLAADAVPVDGAAALAAAEAEDEDAVAPWIRANFPAVKSARDVDVLFASGGAASLGPCDECAARRVAVACVACALALCWRCADAIHIVPELAAHPVRLATATDAARDADGAAATARDSVAVDTSPAPSPRPTPRDDRCSPVAAAGCDVLFRAADCGRWPRELLHGVVVSASEASASASADGESRAFLRVLWLRGVETLADGSFRASLVLPAPRLVTETGIAPTAPIGVFPTRLGALRAVAAAEALARRSRRHARAAAVLHGLAVPDPSRSEIAQVRCAALDALDRLTLACPLRPADDAQFLAAVAAGRWDLDAWLARAAGEELTREWQDEGLEHLDGGAEAAWPAPKPQLVRLFSLDARALSRPERERTRRLRRVVDRLLFVSMGFAWARWRRFVQRHRRRERRELETRSAAAIQRWSRRRWRERSRSADASSSLSTMARSMDELEQLFRRRQAAARSLFALLAAQWERRMRRAVGRWAAAAELGTPGVQRRTARVQHSTRWHPSHGLGQGPGRSGGHGSGSGCGDATGTAAAPPLPARLPRMFAHATPDGRVAVEDAARFQQFRATHAGPTAASYWLLRGRVLLGAYPGADGPASDALKARQGGLRVGGGAAGSDQRGVRAGSDPVTGVLLERVDTFVCLVGTRELRELEEQLERAEPLGKDEKRAARNQPDEAATAKSATETTPWRFERLVRRRQDALLVELRAGEKRAARQLALALQARQDAAEALAARQASRRSTAQDVADAELELGTAAARCELARQHDAAARAALAQLSVRLEFAHAPVESDGRPGDAGGGDFGADVRAALALVAGLEERLRAGRSVFAFSRSGHGRTGLVGALLLGRLYGLPAREALERAQRVHDCQPRFQALLLGPSGSTTAVPASPTSARHVALVRAALAASTDAIYAPLTRENPAEAFVASRAARRGLLGAPLLAADGALLSAEPDEPQRQAQLTALRAEQRVAAREAAAHKRARDRSREGRERAAMGTEDVGVEDESAEVRAVVAAVVRRVEGRGGGR